MINAIYELGVTNGTNNMVGENGTFEPTRPVTRAQMASFIMRTMGHTNLRPAGLTAQQTPQPDPGLGAQRQLRAGSVGKSSRADRLRRIPRTLSTATAGASPDPDVCDGHNRRRRNERVHDACSIDIDDERTDTMGNFVFPDVGSAHGSKVRGRLLGHCPPRYEPDAPATGQVQVRR